ncbi:MAG: hypothetical protein FWE24_11705 [Defluviitaleaceae bacterium]|nr:hypothetical protein [Defluviitaleaceae bacterium]
MIIKNIWAVALIFFVVYFVGWSAISVISDVFIFDNELDLIRIFITGAVSGVIAAAVYIFIMFRKSIWGKGK